MTEKREESYGATVLYYLINVCSASFDDVRVFLMRDVLLSNSGWPRLYDPQLLRRAAILTLADTTARTLYIILNQKRNIF